MINILTVDKELFLNKIKLVFQSEGTFKESLKNAEVAQLEILESNGYLTYGFDCLFLEMQFSFNQTYHNGKKSGHPFLIWQEGMCSKLQWDSSKSDLDNDIKMLVLNIENKLNIKSTPKNDHEYLFLYKSLTFTVFYSIQSMNCSIEFNI
ncbi:hypothetical protein RFI36_17525 [Acinetobacter gerneri]|uniref:Uncharacterized protein n=1 Tax=Acinetobacter gerneri TaxID=202952 RepID=A0AAW8JLW3_9GAMM|nr:hypothetical protein [Acinetobacter gerneri]MDQ9011500.1 hypothetical protein [Acinetobacter gerneri]MDQ9015621.1 hypothetical protein [Acinetobacter gerneri]MDQ9026792.1 hypothetical protein [Acinetobacter gerneri]MDQ9054088.1 hypothetical protein [Acinetobacter gerneri]MDQ9061743.1 hypothetical protein [Acinetobacter gerneri]